MHNVESRGTRHTLLAAGFAASLIALVGSCILNFRYGHALARTNTDGLIFGMLAIASDVFMATSLFFYFEAKKKRQAVQMLAAIVVWGATTLFAGVAAISQASMNRIDAVAHRSAASTAYSDTREELTQAREQRKKLGNWTRPEATVRAEIEKHKTGRAWSASSECSEIGGKAQREFCAQYQTLVAELGSSQQVGRLDKRIEDLVSKSDTAIENNVSVTSEADPAAASIAMATGATQRAVQTGIIFGFAGLMLILCSIGPYITSAMLAGPTKQFVTIDATQPILPGIPEPTPLAQVEIKQLALPKPPAQAAPVLATPMPQGGEPSPEWRALLDAIDFPRKKLLGVPQRPKDGRAVLGWRFLVWLCAHGHLGEIETSQIDRLYDAFSLGDHRAQWPMRIVKAELRDAKKWVTVKDNQSPTLWIIRAPPMARLKEVLAKRGVVIPPTPAPLATAPQVPAEPTPKTSEEVADASAVPFVSPASGKPSRLQEAASDTPRRAIQGLAELQRKLLPNLEAMRKLERVTKAAWQSKMQQPHRKQLNRFSRARAA
jgi:hypothetical protein